MGRCLGPDDTGYPGSGTTQSISFQSSALVGCFLNSTKVDMKYRHKKMLPIVPTI